MEPALNGHIRSGAAPVWSRLLAPVMAAIVLAASANPTLADHGGRPIGSLLECERPGVSPPRCTSVANNLRHHVVFDATVTDGLAASLRDSMAEDYEPTELVMVEQARVTVSTDVIVFSEDYGDNGAAGWVYCPPDAPQGINTQGDRWCRRQELHFNLNPRFGAFFADDGSRDHVACHELGHTIGLRHWGNPPQSAGPRAATCMNVNMPDGPTTLHQIDIDHINAYPYRVPRPSRGFRVSLDPQGDGQVGQVAAGAAVEGLEVDLQASLRELVRSADAIVRARVQEVAPGRVFGAADRGLAYAAVTLAIEGVVAGVLPPQHAQQLTLEVPLFGGAEAMASVRSALPAGDGLFFLRSKGTSARRAGLPQEVQLVDADYYRLVSFDATIASLGGVAVVGAGDSDALERLDGMPFDEAITTIRGAAR